MGRTSLISSRNKQRAITRFFWAKGHTPTEIFNEMHSVYGQKCLTRSIIHRWCEKFPEAEEFVREWLTQQTVSFFAEGIQKLVSRWDKCLHVLGGYVEK